MCTQSRAKLINEEKGLGESRQMITPPKRTDLISPAPFNSLRPCMASGTELYRQFADTIARSGG